jgi:O-methyltransferase involved in polyketide biosynthesis
MAGLLQTRTDVDPKEENTMTTEPALGNKERMTDPDLQGIARTLLVPLACRAIEAVRPDTIINDPRSVDVYNALGGNCDFLLGMSGHDLFAAVMRVRQFDTYTRTFLARYPGGLVVDIGCGLDTRFNRLDDGQLIWLGVDLPEVIDLRRQWLPDAERCKTISQSMFDLSWLNEVVQIDRPVIFLAEGVFPYFRTSDVKPMLIAMAERFPAGELVFDAMTPFLGWLQKMNSSVLKRSGTQILWDARNPAVLETWGLCLLERWGYFDKPEPRLGAAGLMRYIPPLANGTYILHYRLSQ